MSTQGTTVYRVLFAISLVHLLNDSLQAVIPAVLPILQSNLTLSYTQIGFILLVGNVTASILQPFIGYYSDRTPRPYLLPAGMIFSGVGMLGLAFSQHYYAILLSVALVGIGSAVFHPESSRLAYMASGPRRGLGQSIFQVGGNTGQALAPMMTYAIFIPLGQIGTAWFSLPAALAICVLIYLAIWYSKQNRTKKAGASAVNYGYKEKRLIGVSLLVVIISVRSWIYAGYQSFYQLYLIKVHAIDAQSAQVYVFLFLLAGAIGTFFGGPIADRFGKRNLLIVSTLGSLPLALIIPYVTGIWAYPLLFLNGLILLSSFSVAVVYAQELMPGRIGTVSGLITGLAFGMGGIGAATLGRLADLQGLPFVMTLCSLLPLVGFLGFFLPKDKTLDAWEREAVGA